MPLPKITLSLGVFLLLTGCLPKSIPNRAGDAEWGVQVTWYGQSCFSFQDSLGRSIVIDPFDDTVGYGRLSLRADAILITHDHFDHDEKRAVRPRGLAIDYVESTGTISVAAEMNVIGLDSFHDNVKGQLHGKNRIYIFGMGGLKFVHLGDLGQDKLTAEQLKQIGSVDILMIPVGGVTTINAAQAKLIVDQLKPAVIFPMHFGDIRFYRLNPLENFTRLFPKEQIESQDLSTLRLKKTSLPAQPTVYVLNVKEKG